MRELTNKLCFTFCNLLVLQHVLLMFFVVFADFLSTGFVGRVMWAITVSTCWTNKLFGSKIVFYQQVMARLDALNTNMLATIYNSVYNFSSLEDFCYQKRWVPAYTAMTGVYTDVYFFVHAEETCSGFGFSEHFWMLSGFATYVEVWLMQCLRSFCRGAFVGLLIGCMVVCVYVLSVFILWFPFKLFIGFHTALLSQPHRAMKGQSS